MIPRYQHDCPACLFMGRHGKYDTYYCPSEAGGEHGGSVIARFGDEAGDYASSPVSCALTCDLNLEEHPEAPHVAYVRLARRLLHDGFIQLRTDHRAVARRRLDWMADPTWEIIRSEYLRAIALERGHHLAAGQFVADEEDAYRAAMKYCCDNGLKELIPK